MLEQAELGAGGDRMTIHVLHPRRLAGLKSGVAVGDRPEVLAPGLLWLGHR